jgi:hypothetical protein
MPVLSLAERAPQRQKRNGRRPNLVQPPIPKEVLDGMSELEREHFEFFIQAYEQAYERKYGKLTPTAQINITQAGLDYIHLWRMQGEQMRSKTLVSMARQHPGVQIRAWLTACGLCEKDLEQPKQAKDSDDFAKNALLGLAVN